MTFSRAQWLRGKRTGIPFKARRQLPDATSVKYYQHELT